MTKRIRVDFAGLSVQHDVWNFEVMKGLAEMLLKRLFPYGGGKMLCMNYERCWVDYEVPITFDTNLLGEHSFYIRAMEIKD